MKWKSLKSKKEAEDEEENHDSGGCLPQATFPTGIKQDFFVVNKVTMDRNIVPTAALNWLIAVINEGGKERDKMFQDGLRSYALAQSKLYVKGLGKMSYDEQASKMGAAFLGHCKETINLFKKVTPTSMTPEYISANVLRSH